MADNRTEIKIVVDDSSAVQGIKRVENELGSLEKQAVEMAKSSNQGFDALTGGALKAGIAMGATAGIVGAVIDSIKRAIIAIFEFIGTMGKAAEEAGNLGIRLGVSAKQALELQGIADIAGVSIGSLTGAARLLSDALEGSGSEGKKTYLALEKLGVSVDDGTGHLREMGVVLQDVIQHLSNVSSDAERTHLATQILGRGAKEIMPLVAQYKELRTAVNELYGGIDEELLQKLQNADDTIDKMGIAWKAFRLKLAEKIEPLVVPIVVAVTQAVSGNIPANNSSRARFNDPNKIGAAMRGEGLDNPIRDLGFDPSQVTRDQMHGVNSLLMDAYSQAHQLTRTFETDKVAKIKGPNASYERGMALYTALRQYLGYPENGGIGPNSEGGLAGSPYEVKQAITPNFKTYDNQFKQAQEQEKQVLELQLDTIKRVYEYDSDSASRAKDRQLQDLQLVNAQTIDQKLAVEGKKAEIEKQYQIERLAGTAKLLEAEQQIELAKAGENAALRAAIIEKYGVIGQQKMLEAANAIETAQKDAQIRQVEIIKAQQEKTFQNLKDGAGRVFDALLTRSQSVWKSIADVFKTTLLTAIREVVSSNIARALSGLFSGVGGSGSGASNGTGGIGGILGGLGSIFRSGGSGVSATTPPFVGSLGGTASVAAIPGLVGFGINSNGQLVNSIGGGSQSALSRFLGGGSGIIGTKSAQGIFGASGSLGKFGGAAQAGLLTAGLGLGLDGWSRGGWTGAAELTGAGASIGFAVGGPLGAGIGAAIGGAVGIFKALFGGNPQKKMIDEVKRQYGVTIDSQFAKYLTQQAGGQDIRMFVSAASTRQMIFQYAQMTGQRNKISQVDDMARGVFLNQTGSSVAQSGNYIGNSLYGYSSSLSSAAGLTTYAPNPTAPTNAVTNVVLDKNGTSEFLTDLFVGGIANNSRAVQQASNSATSQSFGRTTAAINMTDPLAGTI